MIAEPNYQVADAMRKVAMRLDKAFAAGVVAQIDANQVAEILLSIAEELDPPLPKHDLIATNTER